MPSTKTTVAKSIEKKNYDEMRVEIEPGHHLYLYDQDPEVYKERLESWAKEIHDFLRDHRSMDVNDVFVVIPVFKACSECGDAWEPYEVDDVMCCANCGVPCE